MRYRKNCVHCQQEILINKEGEKWHAFEISGDPHRCRNKMSIVKEFDYCHQAIQLLMIENRYRPYNEDRTLHRCGRNQS